MMISALTGILLLVIDQITKVKAATDLAINGDIKVWEGVLHFTYVENRGAAFGMMQGGKWFFLVITGVAVAGMIWFLIKERKSMHFLMQFSICLLLSGAIGNLIDRVALGYVRDMIYVAAINFPVFNVADMGVCVGCGLLMLDILFFKGKKYLAEEDKPQAGEEQK
ncbi:MAG: signal peptidase II [Clostridia bacterium]|nr:signal peptidase II [Clostridia bacterium]